MEPKILVVEDHPETLDMITLVLERKGYAVIVASNGSQGLVSAASETPDLIVVDMRMPQMDGIEMIRELRQHEGTPGTPILAITAYEMEYSSEAMRAGAHLVMAKPFTDDTLLASVRALLGRGGSSSPISAAGSSG